MISPSKSARAQSALFLDGNCARPAAALRDYSLLNFNSFLKFTSYPDRSRRLRLVAATARAVLDRSFRRRRQVSKNRRHLAAELPRERRAGLARTRPAGPLLQ